MKAFPIGIDCISSGKLISLSCMCSSNGNRDFCIIVATLEGGEEVQISLYPRPCSEEEVSIACACAKLPPRPGNCIFLVKAHRKSIVY